MSNQPPQLPGQGEPQVPGQQPGWQSASRGQAGWQPPPGEQSGWQPAPGQQPEPTQPPGYGQQPDYGQPPGGGYPPQPPTGGGGTGGPGAEPPEKGGKAGKIVVGLVAVLAIVAAVIFVPRLLNDDDDVAGEVFELGPGEILLEPATDPGPDPFSATKFNPDPDVTLAKPVTGPTEIALEEAITIMGGSGGEPGLFGGTQDSSACDPVAMVEFLRDNPDKAAAWVAALNADPDLRWEGGLLAVTDIPAYVATLTPTLTLDPIRVTNHGYAGPGIPSVLRQSLLQEGSAVLVDAFGVLRVKCACGNPLIGPRPVSGTPTFVGDAWEGFDPALIKNITPNPDPIAVFVLTDYRNGTRFERPAGSPDALQVRMPGSTPPPAPPAPTASSSVTPTPTPTPATSATPTAAATPTPTATPLPVPTPTATSPATTPPADTPAPCPGSESTRGSQSYALSTYTHDSGAFSLSGPSDWEAETGLDNNGAPAMRLSPDLACSQSDGFRSQPYLYVEDLRGFATDDPETFLGPSGQAFPGCTWVDRVSFTIGGYEGVVDRMTCEFGITVINAYARQPGASGGVLVEIGSHGPGDGELIDRVYQSVS